MPASSSSAVAAPLPAPFLRRLVTVGDPANRLLRFAILILAIPPTLYAFQKLFFGHPFGVDLEIPLRAAERWVNGGVVYDPAQFQVVYGAGLPYLYPPFLLPFLVPLLAFPLEAVLWAWVLCCLAAAVWSLHRLRVPWVWMPLCLISPPFAEGILGGNVQIVLFALFCALFVAGGAEGRTARDFHPPPRDPADAGTGPPRPASDLREGVLAATIAAFKVSQLHPWLYLLRHRWRAAFAGVAVFGVIVLVTLPLTGIDLWFDWLEQVRRAADPAWMESGLGLAHYLGSIVGTPVAIACLVAVLFVPRRTSGAWIGVLSVVGSVSLRTFGILFLAPAGLAIRRELGLLAFLFIGTFLELGMWIGIMIVAVTWVAAARWPVLLEP